LAQASAEAEGLASRLSVFFPEANRWRWQRIFFAQAFGTDGNIKQRQAGGRPKQQRVSDKQAFRYRRMVEAYHHATGYESMKDYCQDNGIVQRTLQRAILWYMTHKGYK